MTINRINNSESTSFNSINTTTSVNPQNISTQNAVQRTGVFSAANPSELNDNNRIPNESAFSLTQSEDLYVKFLYEKARTEYSQGNHLLATTALKNIMNLINLSMNKQNISKHRIINILILLGICLTHLKDPQAKMIFQEAAKTVYSHAKQCYIEQKYDEAIKFLNEILMLQDHIPSILLINLQILLGICLKNTNQTHAQSAFYSAAALTFDYAQDCLSKRSYVKAINALEGIIKLNEFPPDYLLRFNILLGICYEANNQIEKGYDAFSKVVPLVLLQEKLDFPQAILKTLESANANGKAYLHLCMAYYQYFLGRPLNAIHHCYKGLQYRSTADVDTDLRICLALSYQANNQPKMAISELETYIQTVTDPSIKHRLKQQIQTIKIQEHSSSHDRMSF